MTCPSVHLDLVLPLSVCVTKMNIFKDNTFNDVQGNYVCSSLVLMLQIWISCHLDTDYYKWYVFDHN